MKRWKSTLLLNLSLSQKSFAGTLSLSREMSHIEVIEEYLGSIVLTAISDNQRLIEIRHIVIEGWSQWIICKTVTGKAVIQHMGKSCLVCNAHGPTDDIKLVDYEI